MKQIPVRRASKTSARADLSSEGGIALLESEIDELREKNARLQRRLEEAEMSAEFQASASRILAIPPPKDV
jgi:hypothetical protein